MPEFKFTKAVRREVPILISIASVSGGGKTFSALLLAAGLAGKAGRVGFLDTENGRGEMYTDSPSILSALPNSFEYSRLDPPFSPANYIEGIAAAEKAGINVLVIDSATHEWEGTGGCCEIAEKNPLGGMPNWSRAKMEHKKFVNHCLASPMHLIFCIRARDKVKMVKSGDLLPDGSGGRFEKSAVIPLGVTEICEKSFVFEQLLSLRLDEKTHFARAIKVPEPLAGLFFESHLITKEDGAKIAQWNSTGQRQDDRDQLQKRARLIAETGMEAYTAFYQQLTPVQKKALRDTIHDELKVAAQQADAEVAQESSGEAPRPTLKSEPPRPPVEMDVPPTNDMGEPGQEALAGGHLFVKQDPLPGAVGTGEWKDMGKQRGGK